jgi:DNA-binding winged helix-turn-helix (wHTH) protein
MNRIIRRPFSGGDCFASMIPKSGYRFSGKVMLKTPSMIPKSGYRFSEKIMLRTQSEIMSR